MLLKKMLKLQDQRRKDKPKHDCFQLVLQFLKHSNFIEYQNRH